MNCDVCGRKIDPKKEPYFKRVRMFKGKSRKYCENCNSKLTLTGVPARSKALVAVR